MVSLAMTKNEMLMRASSLMDGASQPIYDLMAAVVRQNLSPAAVETLRLLVACGPIWDGDLPSKLERDRLVDLKLAVKCVSKGSQGFQAATYRGWNVFHAVISDDETA